MDERSPFWRPDDAWLAAIAVGIVVLLSLGWI